MIKRLVQLAVLSVLFTMTLIASVPEKRTAMLRLEAWVIALLVAVLLVHLIRRRLPLTGDPLARPGAPEAPDVEPTGVDALVGVLGLASSPHERIRRTAQIQLRDALAAAGAPLPESEPLPATPAEWSLLLDEIEAS